jgi:hypothetical protein
MFTAKTLKNEDRREDGVDEPRRAAALVSRAEHVQTAER